MDLFWLFTFILMNLQLFGCAPLFSWSCLVDRLYIHVHVLVWVLPLSTWACSGFGLYLRGRVWVFDFIYMDLIWCLTTWTCLGFAINYMYLFGCSSLTTLTFLVVLIYLSGLV